MSHLDELVRKLCSEGVQFKSLYECAEIGTGNKNRSDASENGKYPFYVRSKEIKHISTFSFNEEAVIIPGEGGIGDIFHYINGKYALHQRAYRISLKDNKLLTKFIYYFASANFKRYILSKSVNATVKSIRKPMLENFKVPVPPLEIQHEIVRILDSFSKLEAELEAELEKREKQYIYYRNDLLSFESDTVEFAPLAEVFEMKNGYTPPKSDPTNWINGSVPWFRMEDIRENGRVLNRAIQRIPEKAVKGNRLFPSESLIIATSATIGEHALITVPFLSNQRFTALWPKSDYHARLNMKFVFYYGFILAKWCRNNITTSSFASVDMTGFKRFPFPVPPLEVQNEIVAILDKFDALVHDISAGLPAEIAARRKQYEHYRDKLLTFEELAA